MSSGPYSEHSARQYGAAKVLLLALTLAAALLVATSFWGCTIKEITLYKTVHEAQPRSTPIAKIGPS